MTVPHPSNLPFPRSSEDPASPLRVLIVGGGVAGLETLMALRGLAGDLVTLTLIAPEDEFVYSPLPLQRPFPVGRMRRAGLSRMAQDAAAPVAAPRAGER